MKDVLVGRVDLVRALAAGGEELQEAVADLLGFERKAEVPPPPKEDTVPGPQPEPRPEPESVPAGIDVPFWQARDFEAREPRRGDDDPPARLFRVLGPQRWYRSRSDRGQAEPGPVSPRLPEEAPQAMGPVDPGHRRSQPAIGPLLAGSGPRDQPPQAGLSPERVPARDSRGRSHGPADPAPARACGPIHGARSWHHRAGAGRSRLPGTPGGTAGSARADVAGVGPPFPGERESGARPGALPPQPLPR